MGLNEIFCLFPKFLVKKNSSDSKQIQNWVWIFWYHLSLACVPWQSQFLKIINTRLFLTSLALWVNNILPIVISTDCSLIVDAILPRSQNAYRWHGKYLPTTQKSVIKWRVWQERLWNRSTELPHNEINVTPIFYISIEKTRKEETNNDQLLEKKLHFQKI